MLFKSWIAVFGAAFFFALTGTSIAHAGQATDDEGTPDNIKMSPDSAKTESAGTATGGAKKNVDDGPAILPLDPVYFGLSYARSTVNAPGAPDTKPSALEVRIGYLATDYIGVEARYGLGLMDDSNTVCFFGLRCYEVGAEIDNYYSAFGRAYFAEPSEFRPYILLGYTRGEFRSFAASTSITTNETGMSYGFGFEVGHPEQATAIEYINLIDKDGLEVDVLTIGYKTTF